MNVQISSEEEMKSFGEKLAKHFKGGEVLQLVGDVGAGKTTFVKGLARGLAIDDDVQSPSFTISRVYRGRDDLLLAHYDFYRLSDAGIMADELAEVVHDSGVITVVEWADIVTGVLPKDTITITFTSPSETLREVTLPDMLLKEAV